MKQIHTILFIALLFTCMLFPSAAAEEQNKSWKITATAHLLSNRSGELVVYLNEPGKLKLEQNDYVAACQALPVGDDTRFLDKQGGAINHFDILPGQRIKVSMRYTYKDTTLFRYDREAKPMLCYEVKLMEDLIPRVKALRPDELKADIATGTIVGTNGGHVRVYIELGFTTAANGTRCYSDGIHVGEVDSATTITGAGGKKLQLRDIKPFQRVRITGAPEFYDGSLGFEWVSFSKIEVLGAGESVYVPQQLISHNTAAATVLENRAGAELLVRAHSGSWAGRQQDTYLIALPASTLPAPPFSLQAGDEVVVRFKGISFDESPGRLVCDWGGVQLAAETAQNQ